MFVAKKIVKDTNIKQLRVKSKDVPFPLSDEINDLCQYLIDHLRISQDPTLNAQYKLRGGVGLAAVQVGVPLKIFAMHIKYEDSVTEHVFINPVIIAHSIKKAHMANGEGCLSVENDVSGVIYRHNTITIKAYDYLTKQDVIAKFKGYEAIVVQHELDHFNGILYYDLISKSDIIDKDSISIT